MDLHAHWLPYGPDHIAVYGRMHTHLVNWQPLTEEDEPAVTALRFAASTGFEEAAAYMIFLHGVEVAAGDAYFACLRQSGELLRGAARSSLMANQAQRIMGLARVAYLMGREMYLEKSERLANSQGVKQISTHLGQEFPA